MGRRGGVAVGHRKDNVGFVWTGKSQLHDLFERNLLSLDFPQPRVDNDLERLGRGTAFVQGLVRVI